MASKEDTSISSIIKKAGLKVTSNRVSLLKLLSEVNKPLSIDEIKKHLKHADSVTIYRILKVFSEKGIIYQTDFRNGKSYFEFQDHHHHHIVCHKCGDKESVDICLGNSNYKKIIKQTKKFSIVNSHMLEFFGLCKNCS